MFETEVIAIFQSPLFGITCLHTLRAVITENRENIIKNNQTNLQNKLFPSHLRRQPLQAVRKPVTKCKVQRINSRNLPKNMDSDRIKIRTCLYHKSN